VHFRGDHLRTGAIVHAGVQGEYDVINRSGFIDFAGWIRGSFRSGESFRLKLDDGHEFGIMIGSMSHGSDGTKSHFKGNALAT
jgi:hypothetical protein